jgi:tetratricopeptide (TPR) repeat protein
MEKNPSPLDNQDEKVVHLQLDASFFFERAVRSLNRQRYDKAIKYFRLAMEKEPDNTANYCNFAGILAELGRYEESNEMLEIVVYQIDPTLYECLFYMANNAANMGDFETAEDYLLAYLSHEPDGEYVEEAEDLLYMISFELGRPPREPEPEPEPVKLPAHIRKQHQARHHLEEGRFAQAIPLLEELVAQEPHFLTARNQLVLAYYYMGRLEEAMQCMEQVLEIDASHLHTLCNLAILSHHMNETKQRQLLLQALRKLVPLQQEHAYKLATTMGVLGEHQMAYRLFYRLLQTAKSPEASLYHYAAVAAYNTGRIREALTYWEEATAIDAHSYVPSFYLEQVQSWVNQGRSPKSNPVIPYQYHLSFAEEMFKTDAWKPHPHLLTELQVDPLFRSSIFQALHHGDRHTKLHVLHVLGWIHDQEVEQALRQFLLRPEEDEELKKIALLILHHMKEELPFPAWMHEQKGEVVALAAKPSPPTSWQQVIQCCLQKIKEYDADPSREMEKSLQKVQVKWSELDQDLLPTVGKVEAWAAALEYTVAKLHGIKVTQREVSQKYHIAISTLAKHVKQLTPVAQNLLHELGSL